MAKLIGLVSGFFLMFFVIVLISTFIVKLSWAYSVTPMFGYAEPTWLQAFALSCLCSSLFKGTSSSSKS